MGDVQPCTNLDPHCPPDMRYQYNTDVVFDTDGKLLTKYHKQNLYHENAFNTPTKCEHVTFTTSFGIKFGVFTCFDMLFKCPAFDLVTNYDVYNVVMPTAWMDGFPTLVSVQYQQAWSRATCINLIAANQHQPLASMYGSGIYSCGEPKAYLFDPLAPKERRLMLATLSDFGDHNNSVQTTNNVTSKAYVMKKYDDKNNHDIDHGYEMVKKAVINQLSETFKCKISNDIYDVIRVEQNKGSLSICQNKLCCNLVYEIAADKPRESYVLGVFRGPHTPEKYFIEVCVLFKCASYNSCGHVVQTSSTVFSNFELSGNFTSTAHVFPGMLVSGMRLVAKDDMQVSGHSAMTMKSMKEPLISAVLFARDYSKDK